MAPFARFEIFRRVNSGNVEWIDTVETLWLAREHLQHRIAKEPPADYFIFDRLRLRFMQASELQKIDQEYH